ncbi:MAG: aminotransferase class V-fold PLP-dependent enzyme, partial [Bacteroidota bacterium]
MSIKGFSTKVLHTPFPKEDPHGSIRMPVYDTAAFDFDDCDTLAAAFSGETKRHVYSRSSNPTVEYLEQVIKNVTGAKGALCLSSGNAAIANLVLSIVKTGDNIVTTKYLFGNTYSFFKNTLQSFGIEVKFIDLDNLVQLEKSIDEKTRCVFLESISNPHLKVFDFKRISAITREKKVLLVADTTLTPLCFFNAKEYGVDVEVISSTKYLSGGATSTGGGLIDHETYDWSCNPNLNNYKEKYGSSALMAKLRKESYRNMG